MSSVRPKRLGDIRNDLDRGVFLSVYNSRGQRMHRQADLLIPGLKHGLRGTLFSCPLYLLPLAAWSLKASYLPLILRPGYSGRLLFSGNYIS